MSALTLTSGRSKGGGNQAKNHFDADDGLGGNTKFDHDMGGPSGRRRMNRGADGKFESALYKDGYEMQDYPTLQS